MVRHHSYGYSSRRKDKKGLRKLVFTLLVGVGLLYLLVSWLLPTLIGGLSFVNKFKNRPTATKSASEDTTIAPPVLNIPYEATNTASIKINGYTQSGNQVEIYLDDELKDTIKAGDDGNFMSGYIDLSTGKNNIYGKTIDDKDHKSLPSKTIQITYLNEKPKLDVNSPSDNQVVKGGDKKVTVSGSTNPNGISIDINGTRAIVNGDGNFSQSININDGDTNIVITATDSAGNTTQISRKVTYQSS